MPLPTLAPYERLMNAASGSADHDSSDSGDAAMLGLKLNTATYKNGAVQITWTGFNTSDAVLKLQSSVTGTTGEWDDKTGATYTIPSGAGTKIISMSQNLITEPYYKALFSHGTNSAGSVSVYAYVKT